MADTDLHITIQISTRTPKLKKQFEKHCEDNMNISVNKRLQELMAFDIMKWKPKTKLNTGVKFKTVKQHT